MHSRGIKAHGSSLNKYVSDFLASSKFFKLILIIFGLQALWLAITHSYGMAFDEGYHFGLIQFFGNHLSPIVTQQPPDSYSLGAVVNNGSILYHYILSFPYRLLTAFTSDLQTVVMALRLFSVALAIVNLIIISKLLKLIKIPDLVSNLVIFVVALTPIYPVLAAQINYDNLLLPLMSGAIYLTISFIKSLRSNVFDIKKLVLLLSICLFASLVKFEFLPIFVAVVSVLGWEIIGWLRFRRAKLFSLIKRSYQQLTTVSKIVLGSTLLLGSFLFAALYGANMVKYHNPVPSCDQVLSQKACSNYYVWVRNNTLATTKNPEAPMMNPVVYSLFWGKVMYYQAFGQIVPTGGLVYIQPIFKLIVFGLTAIGVLCALINFRRIWNLTWLRLALIMCGIYLLFLFGRNYQAYLHLGEPVAIQGRYLLPVLPFVYTVLGMGIYYMVTKEHMVWKFVRPATAAVIIFSFVTWGGFVRYVQVLSPNYKWPAAQKIDTK